MSRPKCDNCSERHATILCPYEIIGSEGTKKEDLEKIKDGVMAIVPNYYHEIPKDGPMVPDPTRGAQ